MFVYRHPERPPADAVRPALTGSCCRCVAAPQIVFWKVCTKVTTDPHVYPAAGAGVLEIQFCAHHGTALEAALEAHDWILVLDRRQSLIREESPATHLR